MTEETLDPRLLTAGRDLIDEALALSQDCGDAVAEAVRLAADEPLSDDEAQRLFQRILVVLRRALRGGVNDSDAAEEIQADVTRLMASRKVGAAVQLDGVKLEAKYGVKPHQVLPVPIFNGQ